MSKYSVSFGLIPRLIIAGCIGWFVGLVFEMRVATEWDIIPATLLTAFWFFGREQ